MGSSKMINLRGMTWNHERGYAPLLLASEKFHERNPNVNLTWDRRSLKDFGDYPVDLLAKEYDILLIDHPHVGISSSQGVLIPLNEWMPTEYLADQQANSVGPSHMSYNWGGHQWALAVDAAAQVASYRPDLLEHRLPSTWGEVHEWALSLPHNRRIGWPLCPTDAMCSFLSLCANIGGKSFFNEAEGIPQEIGEAALEIMLDLLPMLHESSLASNPIQMYDLMSSSDEIVYVPLAFGYTNYARKSYVGNRLRFADVPSTKGKAENALLGGVGMAVSALSKHVLQAVEFTMFAASSHVQSTIYYEAGGQPGHASAWTDTKVNEDCGDFFEATRCTLEHSYMRPRNHTFPSYQEQAGIVLHEALSRSLVKRTESVSTIVKELNHLYLTLLHKE